MRVEDGKRAVDVATGWNDCKADDATMLEEEMRDDQLRRHHNDFDKTTREFVWTRSRRMLAVTHKSIRSSR